MPTIHGEKLQYMTETYETNWMSTVGANIVVNTGVGKRSMVSA